MSPKKWSKNTFGWARAEVLGALVNAVFLVALCFSITIEACKRWDTCKRAMGVYVWRCVYVSLHTLQTICLVTVFAVKQFFFCLFDCFIYSHSLRLNLHAVCIFLFRVYDARASLHKCVQLLKCLRTASFFSLWMTNYLNIVIFPSSLSC